jgi:hypothetical protein
MSRHDDFEEVIDQYEIRPARVTYVDLCQHGDQSKNSFFSEAGLKELEVIGYTLELPEVVKVMFYNDKTDDSECEGIVIPVANVVSIEWLDADHTGLTHNDQGIN